MNNFNSYIKFLSRNKLYTFVNVLGLSVSLMFVIIIATYTVNELTVDNFQKNVDRTYLVVDSARNSTMIPYMIGGELIDTYPEIEEKCGVVRTSVEPIDVLGVETTGSVIAVDDSFFDIFSFELKQGDRDNSLVSKSNMIISERFAKKMFGDINPMGQIIKLADSLSYTVSGVIEDFEGSILNYADIIINIDNLTYFNQFILDSKGSTSDLVMFLKTAKNSDIGSTSKKIEDYNVVFIPMKEAYFSGLIIGPITGDGDKFVIIMLLIIGGLILVFSIFNYINLTVAQTGFRAKEMSTRRLLGASRKSIFVKIIFESTFLCCVAFLIGILLALTIEPYANELLKTDISIGDSFSVTWGVFYGVLIIALGFISGIIPAIIILRFKPIDVVKGAFILKNKMTFSKIFITLQSVITIVFIACSITAVKQVSYMVDADLGYNQEGVIIIPNRGLDESQLEQLNNKLKALPFVEDIGRTSAPPFFGYSSQVYDVQGVGDILFYFWDCDSTTMKILGIETVKDNNIAEDGVWITEQAMKAIEVKEGVKSFKVKMYNGDIRDFLVKGVVKDFIQGNIITGEVLSFMFTIKEKNYSYILIDVKGDVIDSYRIIKGVFEDIIGEDTEFHGEFIDQIIARQYERYSRLSSMIMIFTFIAIVISALGLLAMSVYFIQQRSKEIAIRKVFGSTSMQVLKKLVWQFLRLVVIAFVIACPIIWYVMSEWLQQFPYRIDLSVWIFISAGAFTLLISFITVFWQSSIAANTNPVDSIKK